jgi:gamma-glutamyltranspeptidase/glutathione hydrolase
MRVKNYLFLVSCLAILTLFYACRPAPAPLMEIEKNEIGDQAMVVSPHPLASEIGSDILRQGGNAVDAAVAVQFAIAVVYPRAGNIGGGGFMVIRTAGGERAALDYREKAPAAAHRDMYLDPEGNVIDGLSRNGHLAVGVPGTVDGLLTALKKYGKLKDLSTILDPAIKLAKNGFRISATEAERLNKFRDDFLKYSNGDHPFIKKGEWREGDPLVQKDLAATLKRIRDNGRAGFYEGATAEMVVAEMQRGNGIVTLEDLAGYRSTWRKPIETDYRGMTVISMPPSSSGGVALTQLLELVEPYPLAEWGFQSKEAVHLIVEAERRVYADRAQHLGDTDYYDVPMDSLMNPNYLKERMADFDPARATGSNAIYAGNFKPVLESFETTHTSVVDSEGGAVSVTTTLNSNYGSKVFAHGAGFFLNNEMDDFSAKTGVPNQFGLVGAEANAIEPGKRMLSSMTPTIVERDGKVFLVLGAPGGSTIITAVFQVLINVAEFGMDLQEAVNAPRFHHQWLPDHIKVEADAIAPDVRAELEAMGHPFEEVNYMAVVKAIHVLSNGTLQGVGDPRNPDDDAEGF